MNTQKHFTLLKTCDNARAGELNTPHGKIPTPVFMPVGSQATVKTLTPEDVKSLGFNMILTNTYHLYLRPGVDVVKKLGGLHDFMGWGGAILTDSGGYQVFSLSPLCKITDEGVKFRSHIDGSEHFLTPELAVKYQEALGADVIMVLDECSAYGDAKEKIQKAMDRTHRWAKRCLKSHKTKNQALYAIVQGGMFPDLRKASAEYLTQLDFPGYAIGGLSVGEPKDVTFPLIEQTTALLPPAKPRYLMGVGAPEDLVEGVARGIDMFDCALPTRVARNGALYTRQGRVNIRRAIYSKIDKPIDPSCDCYTCRTFSAAYLNHLFRAEELLALRLATNHNLRFLNNLMKDIRSAIMDGTFDRFAKSFLKTYQTTNEQTRVAQKGKWLKGRK
ncbi:MAG: tRNA guanosine(34) transglycosylase Tgt [Dehalococcoidales bacterium]|nr:tRNA guanosine(34) transglycosylase Tgt [Dehalococcoidales bacterium]